MYKIVNDIKEGFMFMILKRITILSLLMILLIGISDINAATKEKKKGEKDEIQRTPEQLFDVQQNTVSNVQFYTSNYGIFGLNVARSEGGGYWPRGSANQYIFGGGIWFGAIKLRPDGSNKKKYVEVSYNPNSGSSWMVPGRIDDGDAAVTEDIFKYRTYFSTDMNVTTGEPRNLDDGPNWPIWDASPYTEDTLMVNRYFGYYIDDITQRNTTTYKKGPAFISGEDIFSTYKDTDLNYFEGGFSKRKEEGYPLRLQHEQMIYSWGFGDYRDILFIKYQITNMSKDTLESCWMAPVLDIDLARAPNVRFGAGNDRVRFYEEDTTLNMAFQWTNADRGERGYGFGYLGFDFLESPATIHVFDTTIVKDDQGNPIDTVLKEIVTDSTNFVRRDSAFYSNSSQIGMVTFRNWPIEIDPDGDEERYDFMALGQREGDDGPGDKRFMIATGPFNMRPNDTVRVVIGIILANTSKGGEADGTTEDVAELVRKDKFAQAVYDNNFLAPKPPNPSGIEFEALNHAIKIKWDNESEKSVDDLERGLDFMGYRLYRARRLNLDTFDLSDIGPTRDYTSGRGPYGWREVSRYQIPTPYFKSTKNAALKGEDIDGLFIDSLRIVGLVKDPNNWVDGMDYFRVKLMRVAKGVIILPDSMARLFNYAMAPNPKSSEDYSFSPVVVDVDTSRFNQPWGKWYSEQVNLEQLPYFTYDKIYTNNYLTDSVLVGVVELNSSVLDYNPLFFRRKTVQYTPEIKNLIDTLENGVVKRIDTLIVGSDTLTRDVVSAVYKKNTIQNANIGGNNMQVITMLEPRPANQIMNDSNHVKECLDSIYHYIRQNYVRRWELPDFEQSEKSIKQVITPYFDNLTSGREFVDIGDINRDGIISTDEDPAKTEKIINNVDYYYKILSFDEGDFLQPIASKLNSASDTNSQNLTSAVALASPAGKKPSFEITYVDSSRIGGLYNFNFFAIDNDKVQQQYAGHELELEFQPSWNLSTLTLRDEDGQFTKERSIGLYHRLMTLKDITSGEDLFSAYTYFEVTPCQILYRGGFTENALSWVLNDVPLIDTITGDTVTFGTPYNKEKILRSGEFSSGDFTQPGYCYSYAFTDNARNMIGFKFDYSIQQWGGQYRPDSTTSKIEGNAVTPISFIAGDATAVNKIFTTQEVFNQSLRRIYNAFFPNPIYGSFNNGPAELLVEFVDGGEEVMELQWGQKEDSKQTNTFRVKYLIPKVTNVIKYNRPSDNNPLDSTEVAYNLPYNHVEIPIDLGLDEEGNYVPDPVSLGLDYAKLIDGFNISAYGYINARGNNKPLDLRKQIAKPANLQVDIDKRQYTILGTQGRYYTSAISVDGKDTLDFAHILFGSSVQFAFDYANKARAKSTTAEWGTGNYTVPVEQYVYGEDFKPGDKVLLKTWGGALGIPMPGAKVRIKVGESIPENNNYTDDMLEEINVVPNPYYISHQGQRSPYDAKIYFTKLPKRCTIEIYTLYGDLIQTIEHDELTSEAPDRVGIDAWNLLSSNQQRIQSQTLIALIKTPNGAETVKKFSVVVGGFRIFSE